MQVVHRISSPAALAWSDRCRVLYRDFGVDYVAYAMGTLDRALLRVRSLRSDPPPAAGASALVSEGPRALSHPLVIMDGMDIVLIVVLVVAVGAAAALAGVEITRRRFAALPRSSPMPVDDGGARRDVARPGRAAGSERVVHAGRGRARRGRQPRAARLRQPAGERAARRRGPAGPRAVGRRARREEGRHRHPARRDARRDAHRAHRAGRDGEVARRAERAEVRPGRPVVAQPRRGHPDALRVGTGAARGDGVAHGRAASGASAWPTTCCVWPASSRTSTTSSRPSSTVPRAGPTSRSRCPRATSSTWT